MGTHQHHPHHHHHHHHYHHHHHKLLLSLTSLTWLIIFNALVLLNAQQATGDGAKSCYSANITTCPSLISDNRTTFPFITSQACGEKSSLFLEGCQSATIQRPKWPNFKNATNPSNLTAIVMSLRIPPSTSQSPANQTQLGNTSDNRTLISSINLNNSYGFINLTWNENLVNQPGCTSLASLNQISKSIPESINLTSFAHSSFQFSSSNIILLFNCSTASVKNQSEYQNVVQKDTKACKSYGVGCQMPVKNKNYSCYQYTPSKNLSLPDAMKSLDCEQAMFFTVSNISIHASRWSPGLIELNWSTTGSGWLASAFRSCGGCSNTSGTCGYDTGDEFQCFCANNQISKTNCSKDMNLPPTVGAPVPMVSDEKPKGCKGFSCTGVKIVTGLAVAVGTTVVVSLILLALCCPAHTRKYFAIQKVRKRLRMQEVPGSNPSFSHLSLDGLTERTVEYSYASIVSATNSFTNVLGEGGFGVVYKGTLTHANDDLHMQIAVKVLHVRSKHSKKQFLNEVATIGRIHNVHVVRLLGICIQQNHEILVYEYVINGSLDNWLFNHNQVLHWGQRYAIAVGIAKGLCYLHEECRHRIVHCDIKPGNILLDGQMCPKIADFGLARLMSREESRVATLARGTPGYMAPEFWMGGESQLSTKFDVYSYGMVLLELMSGRRNFSNGLNFPEVAFQAAMRGDFESIMDVKLGITKPHDDDQSMKLDGVQWQQVRTALLVALWCIQDHPGSRPSMSEVVQYLEGNATINEQPPPPAIASTLAVSAQQHPYLSNNRHYSITPISSGR